MATRGSSATLIIRGRGLLGTTNGKEIGAALNLKTSTFVIG